MQEPQSVVHFAREQAFGLSRRVTASCPSRGFAACGMGDFVTKSKQNGDRCCREKSLVNGLL